MIVLWFLRKIKKLRCWKLGGSNSLQLHINIIAQNRSQLRGVVLCMIELLSALQMMLWSLTNSLDKILPIDLPSRITSRQLYVVGGYAHSFVVPYNKVLYIPYHFSNFMNIQYNTVWSHNEYFMKKNLPSFIFITMHLWWDTHFPPHYVTDECSDLV